MQGELHQMIASLESIQRQMSAQPRSNANSESETILPSPSWTFPLLPPTVQSSVTAYKGAYHGP